MSAARGRKQGRPAFLLQAAPRGKGDVIPTIGIGITVTRKIGNAVVRNRARRRLRAALAAVMPGPARAGLDYVLVARPAALTIPFTSLIDDLRSAVAAAARAGEAGR